MRREPTFKLKHATLFEDRQQPWRDSNFSCPVPSMMNVDELQLLHYLAARQCQGDGAIVDFGPLAGASAYCLASGLNGGGHVYSYDRWHFYPAWNVFFPGKTLHEGDDLLPHFLEYVAPFRDRITARKNNLVDERWDHGPIELIFIDAAKAPQVMWHIVNEFFPHLVVGGLVVHQDYVSAECPWIHIAISLLAGYFEYCDSPEGGSVCARLTKKIPPGVLSADYFDSIPVATGRALIRDARDVLDRWFALCVSLAEAHYLVYKGNAEEAAGILASVIADPSFESGVQYDVNLVGSAIQNARRSR